MCHSKTADSPNQIRIILESEAVLGILEFIFAGKAELISSEALHYENGQNIISIRKDHTKTILSNAVSTIKITENVELRAKQMTVYGVKPLDALHLALAEKGEVEYFVTCDDSLMNHAYKIYDMKVKVVNPITLARMIENEY